jgi:hypothetical protein
MLSMLCFRLFREFAMGAVTQIRVYSRPKGDMYVEKRKKDFIVAAWWKILLKVSCGSCAGDYVIQSHGPG